MDDQRWKSIEALYLTALSAPDRSAFLRQACGDDTSLYEAVELLLDREPSTVSVFGQLALTGPLRPSSRESRVLLEPGGQLGPYRITELLGSGGSSDVYKASDTRLNRFVALKVFSGASVTEDFRMRFTRESRAAASLNHPNIATVYEVGETDSPWFIAMEYVDGRTLRAAFADPTCSLKERLGYLQQTSSALARAHANGIAHCDLKPDNIMVTRDGLVKILDFGLVRRAGFANAEGLRIEGTIGYMSPEQAAGLTIDARSDVFSFGCVLFEAATDTLPFSSPSVPGWFDKLLNEPPPRIDSLARDVPPGVQGLVDDCLVKDLDARATSMEDVHRRLHATIQPPRARVNRWLVALTAMAFAMVAYRYWPIQPLAGGVAVLPFVSADQEPESVTMAEQISEGVQGSLTQLPNLKVIAWGSSVRYRSGDSLDVRNAATTLGARTLVVGRVQKRNGQLTITAELVDGGDGSVLWRQVYTPRSTKVGEVDVQIATEVARRIRAELTPSDQHRLSRALHPNDEVNTRMRRGLYEKSLYSAEHTRRAVAHFEAALGGDPNFALANVELAQAYRLLAIWGILTPGEAMRQSERLLLKAIAIDDDLADAHTTLAVIKRDQWNWAEAEDEYRLALRLNPNYVDARHSLAVALTLTGKRDAALQEIASLREFDPVGLDSDVAATAVFYNLRLYDRALQRIEEGMKRDPNASSLWAWRGIVLGGKRDYQNAVEAFEQAFDFGDKRTATHAYYAHALARAGRGRDASKELAALEGGGQLVPAPSLAIAYLGSGDRARALEQLETAFNAREPLLQFIGVESFLDDLKGEPRFKRILTGMGLTP